MGITAYSVHAGSYSRSDSSKAAYTRFIDHVGQLGELCRDRGIWLGVETMYPTSAAISLLPLIVFTLRFLKTQTFMPVGLMAILSLVTAVVYVASLLRGF